MRLSLVVLTAIALAAVAGTASAAVHTFTFDPNVIIDAYAPTVGDNVTVTRVNQEECRRVYGAPLYNGNVSTYNRGGGGQEEYNTYVNWRDSLGEGEGIRDFTLWLAPAWGYTSSFGDALGYNPQITDNYPTTVNNAVQSVTAADGWVAEITNNGPYQPILRWYTTDPTKYLRPGGADIGQFSFTADTAVYNDATYTGEVQDNTPYRVFFWSLAADQNEFNPGVSGIVADGNGFGGITPNGGTFSLDATAGWQFYASTNLMSTPEPGTIVLCVVGVLSLLGFRAWRKR
jgi:hypothetical protein